MGALLSALAPDAVLISDGGGKVARFSLGIAAQGSTMPGLRIEVLDVNGSPAVVAWVDDEPFLTMSLVVADGRIEQVLVVRNPNELARLAAH